MKKRARLSLSEYLRRLEQLLQVENPYDQGGRTALQLGRQLRRHEATVRRALLTLEQMGQLVSKHPPYYVRSDRKDYRSRLWWLAAERPVFVPPPMAKSPVRQVEIHFRPESMSPPALPTLQRSHRTSRH